METKPTLDVPSGRTLGVVVVQMPVGWDAQQNKERILRAMECAKPGDVILTPEGSISGYPTDGNVDDLVQIDSGRVDLSLEELGEAARLAGVALWVGVVSRSEGRWVNEAIELSSRGTQRYRKRNLANHERPLFEPGSELPVFPWAGTRIGVQMCRELRFPDQWSALGLCEADVFLHLNNGMADKATFEIWRSMLVARAHETQRWVVSANIADPRQHAPTVVVAPTGVIDVELPPGEEQAVRVELDLSKIRGDYLSQRVDQGSS